MSLDHLVRRMKTMRMEVGERKGERERLRIMPKVEY